METCLRGSLGRLLVVGMVIGGSIGLTACAPENEVADPGPTAIMGYFDQAQQSDDVFPESSTQVLAGTTRLVGTTAQGQKIFIGLPSVPFDDSVDTVCILAYPTKEPGQEGSLGCASAGRGPGRVTLDSSDYEVTVSHDEVLEQTSAAENMGEHIQVRVK